MGGSEQKGSSQRFPHPSHSLLLSDGCTNCGLMNEKPANSAWSMLAMTSSSGGVSCGWVRVKNLSKFSAALPHCEQKTEQREKFRRLAMGNNLESANRSASRDRRENVEHRQ